MKTASTKKATTKRGGKREGAGRKPKDGKTPATTTSISGPPAFIDQLKADAKKAELPVGEFIRRRVYPHGLD